MIILLLLLWIIIPILLWIIIAIGIGMIIACPPLIIIPIIVLGTIAAMSIEWKYCWE